MELSDKMLVSERYWDPNYLAKLFSEDFHEFKTLWESDMGDQDLINAVEVLENYNPIVEDISLDDDVLTTAVEEIELNYK